MNSSLNTGWSADRGFALVVLVTLATYSAALTAGYVWDDHFLATRAAYDFSVDGFLRLYRFDVWTAMDAGAPPSAYYRPLLLTTFWLERWLFESSPIVSHAHSLLWHVAAVSAVWALLKKISGPTPALWGAALFALHPIQSEVVVYASVRGESMAVTFAVCAFLALGEVRPARLALSTGLALLALLAKETAVVFLVVLPLVDWALGRTLDWRRWIPIGVAVAVYALLRSQADLLTVDGGTNTQALATLSSRWLAALAAYVRMVLWPWPLTTGRWLEALDVRPVLDVATIALGVGLSAGLVAVGGRLALFGLVLAVVTFAPTTFGMLWASQLAERYCYVPFAGLAIAVAAAAPARPRFLLVLVPPAALSLLAIHLRLPDWRSQLDLAASAAKAIPHGQNILAHGITLAQNDDVVRGFGRMREGMATLSVVDERSCVAMGGLALNVSEPALASDLLGMAGPRCSSGDFLAIAGAAHLVLGACDEAARLLDLAEDQGGDRSVDRLAARLALEGLTGRETTDSRARLAALDEATRAQVNARRDRFVSRSPGCVESPAWRRAPSTTP